MSIKVQYCLDEISIWHVVWVVKRKINAFDMFVYKIKHKISWGGSPGEWGEQPPPPLRGLCFVFELSHTGRSACSSLWELFKVIFLNRPKTLRKISWVCGEDVTNHSQISASISFAQKASNRQGHGNHSFATQQNIYLKSISPVTRVSSVLFQVE